MEGALHKRHKMALYCTLYYPLAKSVAMRRGRRSGRAAESEKPSARSGRSRHMSETLGGVGGPPPEDITRYWGDPLTPPYRVNDSAQSLSTLYPSPAVGHLLPTYARTKSPFGYLRPHHPCVHLLAIDT